MKQYHFVTRWFFPAEIEKVWEEIINIETWPLWWSSWKQAKIQGDETQLKLRSVVNHVVRGMLPYSLHFTTEVTRFQTPTLMELTSQGNLVGQGKWVLESCEGGTQVTYFWDVGTPNPVLNLLGNLPYVDKLLEKNHDYIMDQGYQGLKQRLGLI